mmetsp:Transcript_44435/g.126807  ORF Transcript_44435/g.126807 Transcript_44435/m.126807 type:complete len:133 (+) Transcript_44435:80-478(+)|eukprot:CAMPEP_0168385956 /NCGR_PEP_ID=MMETSP0228-20121227/15181_1 /TAXON_ID=133427 /ORGANISM="Protoceratium reticulatum, Strain CCCM 535 (=CCMP 1889)" /LENGTH=132 /DNA_ID=CAMNT_0008399145 /DNA_START=75 /DNA_END=473 /DNA_ORIENTATION=-
MAVRTRSSGILACSLLAVAVLCMLQSFPAPGFVAGGRGAAALRGPRRAAVLLQAAASAETFGKVADVVAEQLGVDKEKVIREATLTELGADSLDIVESVMALEEAFDVELPDDETTALKDVGDVADLIESKL